MAKDKRRILLVGLTYSGDALLLLPKPGGFDLPLIPKKGRAKKCLLLSLMELGFEEISIVAELDPIDYDLEGEPVTLLPFVFAYGKMNQPFETFSLQGEEETTPEIARLFLWRADIYAPLYRQMERTVPFLPAQQKKVQKEIDCLESNVRVIGKKTLEDFRRLCDSAASMRRINEAFTVICNTYHINPKQAEARPEGNKKTKR